MSKLGQFVYNITNKAALWLNQHKVLYYILSCTWGFIMTFIGACVAVVLLLCKKEPRYHKGCFYFIIGKSWGGVELGLGFVTDSHDYKGTKDHEVGHSYQNAIFGPFFLFIAIASAIRYWYREFVYHKYSKAVYNSTHVVIDVDLGKNKWVKKWLNMPEYDAIWFEGSATFIGENIKD